MASYTMQVKKAELEEGDSSEKPIAFSHSDDEQVSVIRKEFVALTGDHFSAVILNQLLYWTQRVRDFDLLLEEERCFNPDCNIPPRYGWIYKTANDLIEETMLGMTHPTMRKYLKLLIDRGWIDERSHPNNKWNKTTQYRANIRKLQDDLKAIGRLLPTPYLKAFSSPLLVKNLRGFSLSSPPESKEQPNVKNLHSSVIHLQSDVKNLHSNVRNLHSYTYTENTSKNINKEYTQRPCAREVFTKNFFEEILEIWKLYVGQDVHLTAERKRQLALFLAKHLKNDLTQWRAICERIKASPFLMGQGSRGWHISFDWILCEENLLKVLEGNFDPPETLEQKAKNTSDNARQEQIHALLISIEDPLWKEWCSQLDFSQQSPNSVSLKELKNIVNAKFLEVEDDRLVWVESADKKTLDQIEDLRLKILSPINRTFPNVRNLRTRLKEKDIVSRLPSPPQNTINRKAQAC